MFVVIFLFNLLIFSQEVDSTIMTIDSQSISNDSISFKVDSTFNDSIKIKNNIPVDDSLLTKSSNFQSIELNDIFYEQLIESKLTFVDAITYDISLDTTEAAVQFHSLFASFEFLDSLSLDDEYKRIEYNMILNASIDYYQNKSVTINKLESPLSMALFKEKLEAYFYKQQLEDVEFVDETVEFIKISF